MLHWLLLDALIRIKFIQDTEKEELNSMQYRMWHVVLQIQCLLLMKMDLAVAGLEHSEKRKSQEFLIYPDI
jgi:hypothetical protein